MTDSKFASIALAALAWCAMPVSANAVTPGCAPYPEVTRLLTERFGEVRLGAGAESRNPAVRFELWVNPDTGTWITLFVDDVDGACPAVSGTGFRFGDEPATPGAPA